MLEETLLSHNRPCRRRRPRPRLSARFGQRRFEHRTVRPATRLEGAGFRAYPIGVTRAGFEDENDNILLAVHYRRSSKPLQIARTIPGPR